MKKCMKSEGHLSWWQMSLIGVGCIIGTGYFLGSSIAIQQAGTSVLFAYLFAGMGTWIVYQSLAEMTASHPEKGSFRTYAKQAFGPWAGFSTGWVYWSSEMLIMGSQLTALAIFAQFWFPDFPVWMLACVFAALGLLVIFVGVHFVERMENVFGIMKVAAIFMFILIAGAAMTGVLGEGGGSAADGGGAAFTDIKVTGLWVAFLYAFYAFGGIEVMGLMAGELKNPKDAPKSGKLMLVVLTVLYIASIYLVTKLTNPNEIHADESPFLTVLKPLELPFVPHVFNSILIIAGFSTLVASLYAVTTILVTLAEEGDAPEMFAKKGRRDIPASAFLLTVFVVLLSILVALLLPEKVFEYLTTAAGLMLLYTWVMILFSYRKLMDTKLFAEVKLWLAVLLITIAVSGTWMDEVSKPGLFISAGFIVLIALATLMKRRKQGFKNGF
ncbi:amino acid permease [Halobacillus yeomjeoni]|uniref:amino acid permease n=1 Tax=Halobacillus yeomjeoni TaxID=311194 RepID=UPI001CD4BB39|nr:amino acid permease [Halobacillus yeomjeoni]MCA0984590.1 amino acid permease [Halobacillus yeomjeoni]